MSEFTLSYREVISDQNIPDTWKEITLTTGGTQSTLQDIKAVEKANGYCYEDTSNHHTRNRFIYWRINYDVLELIEHSLDINLSANKIRFKFADTPILDGISIYETVTDVIVLVPTVCSIHRLAFPHPLRLYMQDDSLGAYQILSTASIFSKVTTASIQNAKSFFVFNHPISTSDQLPHLASTYLSLENEEAYFMFAYPSNEILLIKQSKDGQTTPLEFKTESLVPRFLSGIAEKFRQKNNYGDSIGSVLFQVIDGEVYGLTLCRDGHLKFWSCSRGQCTAVIDVLEDSGDLSRGQAQGGILRKPVDAADDPAPLVAVFVSFPNGGQLYLLRVTSSNQQIQINRINKFYSPENILIDMSLQRNRLWSVWRGEDGECSVYTASLVSSTFEGNNWVPVVLEPLPDAGHEPNSHTESDVHSTYLQYLFQPGRFPLSVIKKALSIYKRLPVASDLGLSISTLKQRICMAVEKEIQDALLSESFSDEKYLEHAEWCWHKFYSCCVQYYVASLKPLGILLLPSVSGAVLLKKSSFSFVRPMEPLEHMLLCNGYTYRDQVINFAMVGEDEQLVKDILVLFDVIVHIERQFSETFSQTFEGELSSGQSPENVILSLIEKMENEVGFEFMNVQTDIVVKLNQCVNLYGALHKILELLRQNATLADVDGNNGESSLSSVSHCFTSDLGASFLSNSLRQQAQTRFSICQNLMLICHFLLNKKELETGTYGAIQSVCYPELGILTKANHMVLWLSGLQTIPCSPKNNASQRLAPIRLTPAFNMRPNDGPISLLEQFLLSTGGREARRAFARAHPRNDVSAHWHLSLLSYLDHVRQLLWPWRSNAALPEWLLSSGQHVWLQRYVRLAADRCDWNKYANCFLSAVSFLSDGERHKALELFLAAAAGLASDPFLRERLLPRGAAPDAPDDEHAHMTYYMKVIQLFELHKARDCAIEVADAALNCIPSSNVSLMATLHSVKFKHHLKLRHYTAAFDSLMANPEVDRKKDNLRDLIKTLLDEKEFDVLLRFTYGNLDELFISILLSRARADNSVENVIYDVLYAYQLKRGPLCHRLAASVMFEQAFRLSHVNSVEALEKQVKCYLAAKNILQLCDPLYAWVVKPVDVEEDARKVPIEPLAGSDDTVSYVTLKKEVEVVGLETIKKGLIFSSAKLKLAKFDPEMSYNICTPVELLSALIKFGLFKSALRICSAFGFPHGAVFESLTTHCAQLTEDDRPAAWDWLVENDLQDLPANRDVAADVAWQLLRNLLEKYEKSGETILHNAICRRIISMKMFLPEWLLMSYKRRNAAELLKLLHQSGRLDEAFEVAYGFLLAALGYGKEIYGISTALAPSSPAFCIPVYPVRCLIAELEIQNAKNVEPPFAKEQKLLADVFVKYMEVAGRVSAETCRSMLTM